MKENCGWLKFVNLDSEYIATWFVLTKSVCSKFTKLHYIRDDSSVFNVSDLFCLDLPEFRQLTHLLITAKTSDEYEVFEINVLENLVNLEYLSMKVCNFDAPLNLSVCENLKSLNINVQGKVKQKIREVSENFVFSDSGLD